MSAREVIAGTCREFIVAEVGFDAGPGMTEQANHLTAAVIDAIRAMSPADLAELIGCSLQGGRVLPGGGSDIGPTAVDLWATHVRVVGPWRPVEGD